MGGKGDRCVGLTTLPPSCTNCRGIWELQLLEPSGPVQTCNGIAFPFTLSSTDLSGSLFVHLFVQSIVLTASFKSIHPVR